MSTIQPIASSVDRLYSAASAGLTMRSLQAANLNPHATLARAKASGDYDAIQRNQSLVNTLDLVSRPGVDEFRYASLSDIARKFVEQTDGNANNLPKHDVVRRAMIQRDAGYHSTGSFTNALLDAANKTLLAAYDEANVTYPLWVRTAPPAPDFKTLNRIRFGELPDPEIVPENGLYPEKVTTDSNESYNVEKHGSIFSISFEAVVNDDLNAISRIPAMQGAAMRRAINRSVYSVLTSNPNLSDSIALFHATSHGANLDSTALDAAALDVGFNIMMTQSGLNSTTILNLMPRYLIVPAALASTAIQIVNSTADPSVGGDVTGSSGVVNIYGPSGPRRLVPVVEGQLDASSTTAWWLACDANQCDTVELTFLEGEESPVLERTEAFTTDAVKYKIRQSWATAPIDFRGLYQGNS